MRAMTTKKRNLPGQVTRPDESTLRDLVYVDLLTDQQIASKYGVTPQAVAYWRKHPRDGSQPIERRRIYREGKALYRHQEIIPWRLKQDHLNDGIADTLRLASRIRQGDESVPLVKRRQVEQFLIFLEQHNRAINYDRDRGFTLPPRRSDDHVMAITDDLAVVIRRPESVRDEVMLGADLINQTSSPAPTQARSASRRRAPARSSRRQSE